MAVPTPAIPDGPSPRWYRGGRKARVERGKPPPGGTRCFGYVVRFEGTVAAEVSLLHEARDRLFSGESVRGVCNDWLERGVVTATGNHWYPQALKRILSSATLSAQREHDGHFFPGTWPPIFSPSDTTRLREMFDADNTSPRRRAARTGLLTGYLRCGGCGKALTSSRTDRKARRYVCMAPRSKDHARGVFALAEPAEAVIEEWVHGVIAASGDLSQSGDEADQIREAAMPRLPLNHFVARYEGRPDEFRRAWIVQSLEWRRSVVGGLFEKILLMPATKSGRQSFDPTRLHPVWRV